MKTKTKIQTTKRTAVPAVSIEGHPVPTSSPSKVLGGLLSFNGEIMMYGKKRIVIQKNYQIVLAGSNGNGGNWCPVGWLRPDVGITGTRFANILKDQYGDQDDFETIQAPSKKALKDVINKKYKWVA